MFFSFIVSSPGRRDVRDPLRSSSNVLFRRPRRAPAEIFDLRPIFMMLCLRKDVKSSDRFWFRSRVASTPSPRSNARTTGRMR